MHSISAETLRTWLTEGRQVALLDVSPHEAWAKGAIPGSLHLEAYQALKAHDPAALAGLVLPRDRPVVTICAAGTPDAIWHNHRLDRLYVAIPAPGVIDVVNTERMIVEEQIATEMGAHTTAYDARRQHLYVFLPSCRVVVYEESEVP